MSSVYELGMDIIERQLKSSVRRLFGVPPPCFGGFDVLPSSHMYSPGTRDFSRGCDLFSFRAFAGFLARTG